MKKYLFGFSLLLLASLVSCIGAPSAPAEKQEVVRNLLPLAPFTVMMGETGALNLSTPYATYYLPRGWTHPYDLTDPERTVVTPTEREAVLRFNVLMPHDRWFIFTASTTGIRGNLPNQQMDVFCAGENLGQVNFGPKDEQHRIHIPGRLLHVGANELTLRFAELKQNPDWLGNRDRHHEYPFPYVCGYFSDMKIHFGDEKGPFPYVAADETEAVKPSADGARLSQQARSEMEFALEIPAGARLVFDGIVQSPTGDPETITVTVSARADGEADFTQLWSKESVLGKGVVSARFSESLDLGTRGGTAQLIRLQVDSSNWLPQAAAVWRKLEIHSPRLDAEPEKTAAAEKAPTPKVKIPKNVVFVVLDATRADFIGCYGGNTDATPTIDALAKESLFFRNATVTAPYTICSVSSLFSGLLPEAHGVRKITQVFPKELESLPKAFRRSGFYTLALAGTQFIMPKFGLSRAFESVIPLRNDGFKSEQVTTMDPVAMAKGVKKAAASGKPFFIYAHFLPPHWPYNPPKPFDTFFIAGREPRVKKAWQVKSMLDAGVMDTDDEDLEIYRLQYLNNLRYADRCVREMIDLLKKDGVWDDTLFIVSADHGEALGDHREFGHTTNVFEQTIHVPLIVHVPGGAPREIVQQVGWLDIFPTFAELFGLQVEDVKFQGRSLAALFTGGDQKPAEYYYSRAYSPKLIFSARGERYKYILNDFTEYYFDLSSDRLERNNLIDRYPASARVLRMKALVTAATGGKPGEEEVKLTKEEQEELKNLGYLQ